MANTRASVANIRPHSLVSHVDSFAALSESDKRMSSINGLQQAKVKSGRSIVDAVCCRRAKKAKVLAAGHFESRVKLSRRSAAHHSKALGKKVLYVVSAPVGETNNCQLR